jgi:predicted RNA polymerase sigma factor
VIDAVYRAESRCVLATLIRLLGGVELAEEALPEAFAAAVERWPRESMPANPRAWLISTGRFDAIDAMRHRARFDASQVEIAERLEAEDDEHGLHPRHRHGPAAGHRHLAHCRHGRAPDDRHRRAGGDEQRRDAEEGSPGSSLRSQAS